MAASIKLRAMRIEDVPAAMKLKNDAGWNQSETDWMWLVRSSPDSCAVACDGDRVVGTVSTITYEDRVAWIGMLVVEETYRREGIGTALLNRALEHLARLAVETVKLDATPAGKPLYEKLGFVSEFRIQRWQLWRSPHQQAVRESIAQIDLEPIFSLDRIAFGVDRTALLRSLIEVWPELALVHAESPTLMGYALGRRGWIADQLGPWVAFHESAAASLLDRFVGRSTRERVFADCLEDSPWAIPLLKSRGFTFVRPLTRMYRGKNCPGTPALLGAVLGPEFG